MYRKKERESIQYSQTYLANTWSVAIANTWSVAIASGPKFK